MKRALVAVVGAAMVIGPVAAPGWAAERHDPTRGPVTANTSYPVGEVVSDAPLNVRQKPTIYSDIVKVLRPHERIQLNCEKRGGWVDGNPVWYRIQGFNGWVSARFVHNHQPVRPC
ncbi:SH3 domain-containing protein [Streptomyces sp. ms191]|uniref:SH3 domain-containing protein n=1 Tax=unclassified Streptomyces TaxID=2593676 RepID=UPI0011CE7C61|nr:SH3 domain-containing protein [Streptomyces sp. ms191]TXS13153.1 SH3 domain-containing protein [Streptomyces sp. ms191]